MAVKARDLISSLPAYIPGKSTAEVKREYGIDKIIKLASNENPFGPSPQAIEAIRQAACGVNIYPDGNAFQLKKALSALYNINEEQLVIANGSDESIHLLTQAFLNPGDEALMATPSFPMYKIAVRATGAVAKEIKVDDKLALDLDEIAAAITSRTKMIMLCNPNNPTGTIIKKQQMQAFLAQLPGHILVVFDEAYYEYVDDADFANGLDFVKDGFSAVVLRTFSKAYGLAGMRVGYSVSSSEIANVLNKLRSPFNVNILGQAAAAAALSDRDYIAKIIKSNREQKQYLYQQLNAMGLKYIDSQSNFIFINVKCSARELFQKLIYCGVIVRAGFALSEWIRVTVGTVEENKMFINALKKIML